MEGNKESYTHHQEPGDGEDMQAPAFLLPSVLASLGLDDAGVRSALTTDILRQALHDEECERRVWAVRALGMRAKEESIDVEPLLAALHDERWEVRATAVFVLADLGANAPVNAIAAALNDEERAVRAAAVRALSLLKEHERIAAALSDPDWLVRETAALALGEVGGSAFVPPLVSSLKDEDSTVREAATWALQQAHPAIAAVLAAEASAPFTEKSAVLTRTPRRVPTRPQGRIWRIAEGAVAVVLVASILLGWLAVARHFTSSTTARQHQPAPTLTPVQGPLPPTQPAKILFNFHGKGSIHIDGWTPDGRFFGFINDNPTTPGEFVNGGEHVYAWDAATKKLTQTFTLPTLPAGVQGNFSFGPGRYLLFLASNGLLQVWDFVSGQRLLTYQQPGGGWVYWGWSNNGHLIAVYNQGNGQTSIWNVATGREVASYNVGVQNIFELLWSPDDRSIAAASNDRVMLVWDVMTGKVVLNVPHYDVEYVEWSSDGQRLFAALPLESQIQIWNVFSGKLLLTSTHYAHTVQWTSDGAHIISFEDHQWLVWDTTIGHTTLTLPVTQGAQNADTTSNDYHYLALSSSGNTVQVWDTATGREVLDYGGNTANSRVLATGWSPDNRHVASLGSDGRLLIWDALTGRTLYSYQVKLPLPPTPALFWSPDGHMIALVSQPIPFVGSQPPLIEILQVGVV